MVRDGELVAYPDPVDKRQRLIAEEALDALVDRRPTPSRLWPRGIGSISDPDLQSDEVEDWLLAHWQP